jgi:hypothetical protein
LICGDAILMPPGADAEHFDKKVCLSSPSGLGCHSLALCSARVREFDSKQV